MASDNRFFDYLIQKITGFLVENLRNEIMKRIPRETYNKHER